MRRWSVLVAAGLWLFALAATLTASPPPVELWRSRYGSMLASPWSAVNPTDGSVWLNEGSTLTHLSADGALLSRSGPLRGPVGHSVVNPGDGSCWVLDAEGTRLLHFAADGARLGAYSRYIDSSAYYCTSPSPNPADGSAWFLSGWQVTRVAADCTELWRSTWHTQRLASADDGTAWAGDFATHEAVHVAGDGTELARLPGYTQVCAFDPQGPTL